MSDAEEVDEWFKAPDPTAYPGEFVAHAVDYYGKETIVELATDVRIDVSERAQEREVGPGAGIAALLVAMEHIYNEECHR